MEARRTSSHAGGGVKMGMGMETFSTASSENQDLLDGGLGNKVLFQLSEAQRFSKGGGQKGFCRLVFNLLTNI